MAGGLAGGSADAAATLVALDRLWDLRTTDDDLLAIAARLGSDVPFALIGGTAQGVGRGELVTSMPDRGSYWWVVVPSDEGLSTPEVYREFDRLHPDVAAGAHVRDPRGLIAALKLGDADRLAVGDAQRPGGGRRSACVPSSAELIELVREHRQQHGDALRVRPDHPRPRQDAGGRARVTGGAARGGLPVVHVATGPGRRRPRRGVRVMAMPNLLNLEKVTKSYGVRILLDEVSLGVGEGERIGIVGRNGDGKTTLLNLMAGREVPDTGRVSTNRGLHIGYLDQRDLLDDTHTVREVVLAGRADHEWAADARMREVVEVLLAGVALDRDVHGLSGGERRRCSLARLLLHDDDLLILDEPTNHLDVEAVAWLADHLVRRTSALVVVTHDRWFLDAVCERTWEVHPGRERRGGGRRLRGRVRRVRARQGRAPRARPSASESRTAEPRPQGAGLAAARPAGADVEAEVPHRRGQRPDRGRPAAARPDGAAEVRHPAARQGRRRPRGRRPDPRGAAAALARHLAARPG